MVNQNLQLLWRQIKSKLAYRILKRNMTLNKLIYRKTFLYCFISYFCTLRLPMSVQMNYPMIQYLKEALQNNVNVMKSLEKLLGSSSSNEILRSNNENNLRDEISRGQQIKLILGTPNMKCFL